MGEIEKTVVKWVMLAERVVFWTWAAWVLWRGWGAVNTTE
jgi:hypothetical protein